MEKTLIFFANPAEFRRWLENNHLTETEVLAGYYKVNTKKPSMTWSDSVDEALCFGWIDGVRRNVDADSYCIRFTPRNPKSNWSAVNIKKVEDLMRKGKMQPVGLAAFEKRTIDRSEIYSYENQPEKLDDYLEIRFQENPKAWSFFSSQAPSYKKSRIYWVMSGRQETTRLNRLDRLIKASESGTRLF